MRGPLSDLAVVLLDSVTQVQAAHAGCVVVTGSHGGASAAKYALKVAAALYVFNDAGVGKDGGGIAGFVQLEAAGFAAAAVAHTSAQIGEARDTYEHGVISRVNARAFALGFEEGRPPRAYFGSGEEK
jgi:hypothetical protein